MATQSSAPGSESGITCELLPGMFDSELIARFTVETPDGPVTVAGFFDRAVLEIEREPAGDTPGGGLLRCRELGRREDASFVVVHLPADTDRTLQEVVVRAGQLRRMSSRQPV